MSQHQGQTTTRYTGKTFLQAIGIGLAANIFTLLALTPFVSRGVAMAAAGGVCFGALVSWSPLTRQRHYWPGVLASMAVMALLWVLVAKVLSLFGW